MIYEQVQGKAYLITLWPQHLAVPVTQSIHSKYLLNLIKLNRNECISYISEITNFPCQLRYYELSSNL